MSVFVFALGDVAKKETKMHFFLTCSVTPLSCCTLRLPENIERFAGYQPWAASKTCRCVCVPCLLASCGWRRPSRVVAQRARVVVTVLHK